jgi:hypothetical protein
VPRLRPGHEQEDRERFSREARAAAALRHPNICPVFDVGEAGGVPFLTMPVIEGQPLSKRLAEYGALPLARLAAFVHTLVLAVEEAHRHGILHRDLKPANILLDTLGQPVITDFGLARRTDVGEERLTQVGHALGTPGYMPPEQATGDVEAMGPACDIYSLGVLLYRLVAGRLPFEGSAVDVMIQTTTDDPPPPSRFRPDLDPRLEAICLKALARQVGHRYPSAGAFAAALAEYLGSTARGDPLSSHYFAGQRELIAEHVRHFVGRAEVGQALDRFRALYRRGYFLLCGGPGQGKTAVAARLVQERGLPHHFISRTGGRSDVRLVLRSLLAQLTATAGIDHPASDSVPELTKALEEMLARLGAADGLCLVIDGLDELPPEAGQELPYLVTDRLPEGVHVVVTSRPGFRLDALREGLFSVPHDVHDLKPLDREEASALLRDCQAGLGEADVVRIADGAQGNPLYLRVAAEEWRRNPGFDLGQLPAGVEGFFRRATGELRARPDRVLQDVLGLLAVARKPLSVTELAGIAGVRQRQIREQGVAPVRAFLTEGADGYTVYHARFHEFVTRELLYPDELPSYHRLLADWLQRPENRSSEYRWWSLARHLYEAGDRAGLLHAMSRDFLAEKVRRCGYAVLEDVELLARALLESGDPALVERCVNLVEGLRDVVGGDVIAEARLAVQTSSTGVGGRSRVVTPAVPGVPGLDVWVGIVPKAEVGADFYEVIPLGGRVVVAVGDAPGGGLKGAFVARFVGNLFRRLVEQADPLDLAAVLGRLDQALAADQYFARVSILCVLVDPSRCLVTLAGAGSPNPVLYAGRRGKSDRLPVLGDLLFEQIPPAGSQFPGAAEPSRRDQRHAEFYPGDVLVLFTDGLPEWHRLSSEHYGWRFLPLIEERASQGARAVGEAILEDWARHPRQPGSADDVTVAVLAARQGADQRRQP